MSLLLAGNRPAIICMGSTVSCSSAGVFAVGRWVTFVAGGVLQIWITVGQGLTVLAVGAGGDCSDIFLSLAYYFFFLSPSLWNGWMGELWFKSFSTEF